MKYDTNHNPIYGEEEALVDGVKVITARNISAYTFSGTRTYIIGEKSLAIIDPGPALREHYNAIIKAIGTKVVSHIFLTHTHTDHCDLAVKLALKVKASIYLFGEKSETTSLLLSRIINKTKNRAAIKLKTNQIRIKKLVQGQKICSDNWCLEVIHTPGHHFDHICLALKNQNIIFSGDHVMGWSSTMISLPYGNMRKYINSLKLLLDRSEKTFFPGHGKPVENALDYTRQQLDHKLIRENQILDLIYQEANDAKSLVMLVYENMNKSLFNAAENNIYAHLIALKEAGKVVTADPTTINSKFAYNQKEKARHVSN